MKMYVVVGLGRFGQSIAHRLCELGNEVLAIDKNSELVQQISNFVTHAVVADAQDADVLRALGFGITIAPLWPSERIWPPACWLL